MIVMRWGLIGASNIAETAFIPAVNRHPQSKIVAVASSSSKGELFSKKHQIDKLYSNYEDLLKDSEVDAVYISLPNHLHKKWSIEAAKHGKHILCEKPAVLSKKDMMEILNVCKENNVQFLEAFMYQFHPQYNRVKEIISSDEIGEVQMMKTNFTFHLDLNSENIRLNKDFGGGAINDIGCYGIHSMLNLIDQDVKSINGVANFFNDVDVVTAVSYKLEDDTLVQIQCSFQSPFHNEITIFGTKGRIILKSPFRPDLHEGNARIVIETEHDTREEEIFGDIYLEEIKTLTAAANGDQSLEKYDQLSIRAADVLERTLSAIGY